jgi:hypothetical protein
MGPGVRRDDIGERFTDPAIPVPIRTQQHSNKNRERPMKLGAAIAEIMKREGVEVLCGYPVNHLIEFAASADIHRVAMPPIAQVSRMPIQSSAR